MIQISPGQASYVLGRLISDRRVSSSDVARYVSEMHQEIETLEERLQALRQASGATLGAAASRKRGPGRPPGGAKPARGRRPAITAEQKQSRIIQGRYLGLIRQIPASRRGQYQKIARERGREAAIKEMAGALGK